VIALRQRFLELKRPELAAPADTAHVMAAKNLVAQDFV